MPVKVSVGVMEVTRDWGTTAWVRKPFLTELTEFWNGIDGIEKEKKRPNGIR
jgi:hypothetical protein